jgi:hypothetical protein
VPEQQKVNQDLAISEISLILMLHFKTSEFINDMAKLSKKSEKITALCRIFIYEPKLC